MGLADVANWPRLVANGDTDLTLSVFRPRGSDACAHAPNDVRTPSQTQALLKGRYFKLAAEKPERRQAVDGMAQNAADDASNRVLAQCIAAEISRAVDTT